MKARLAIVPAAVRGARWIPLTHGKFALVDVKDFARLVDVKDFARLARHCWYAIKRKGTWYAARGIRGTPRGESWTGRFTKLEGRWRAYIGNARHGRSFVHLGTFSSPEEAARAYDVAARRYFGEFARLNFPRRGERGALA